MVWWRIHLHHQEEPLLMIKSQITIPQFSQSSLLYILIALTNLANSIGFYRPRHCPNSIRITILIPNRIQLQSYSPNPTRIAPIQLANQLIALPILPPCNLDVCMHACIFWSFMVKNSNLIISPFWAMKVRSVILNFIKQQDQVLPSCSMFHALILAELWSSYLMNCHQYVL